MNALKGNPETPRFMDQFDGCPVLKFQVVNEHCNREGSEIVDAIMKVVGIKFKGPGGHVTHSQYVRVNLMDFEHPFLSRVWTGVHVLDSTSPSSMTAPGSAYAITTARGRRIGSIPT